MAAPNLLTLTNSVGKTTYFTPTGTTSVVLLPNASGSNKVFKINSLNVANIDGSNAVNATVSVYTNGAVAQGSAPSGGTAYALASTVSVPANASLALMDRASGVYLEENTSITITSGTASKLTFVVSYEELS